MLPYVQLSRRSRSSYVLACGSAPPPVPPAPALSLPASGSSSLDLGRLCNAGGPFRFAGGLAVAVVKVTTNGDDGANRNGGRGTNRSGGRDRRDGPTHAHARGPL
jgi:hypothetical protein